MKDRDSSSPRENLQGREPRNADRLVHARKSNAWNEIRKSLRGLRAPTPSSLRLAVKEFREQIDSEIRFNKTELFDAREEVRKAVIEYWAFSEIHGPDSENNAPPMLIVKQIKRED